MTLILVSKILHKSVIEVNEEGSEAAAVTAVIIGFWSLEITKSLIFDRPFYFILQDKKHCLNLFVGRIVDPSGKNKLGNSREIGKNQDSSVEHQREIVQPIDPHIKDFCGKYFDIPNWNWYNDWKLYELYIEVCISKYAESNLLKSWGDQAKHAHSMKIYAIGDQNLQKWKSYT